MSRTNIKYTCIRLGCTNVFDPPSGTVQYFCSKLCRYIARGSKRGKRLAYKLERRTK